jgi:hypothetical protein
MVLEGMKRRLPAKPLDSDSGGNEEQTATKTHPKALIVKRLIFIPAIRIISR